MRCFATVAALCFVGAARSEILLDDFTSGEFTRVVDQTNRSWKQGGLDTSHSVFGHREHRVHFFGEPPLTVQLQSGNLNLTATSLRYSYFMTLGDFGGTTPLLDVSRESQFRVDISSDTPFSDRVRFGVTVWDWDYTLSWSQDLIVQDGAMFFSMNAFSQPVDWKRVRTIEFSYSSNQRNLPNNVTLKRFSAVPEPSVMLAFALLGLGAINKKANRH